MTPVRAYWLGACLLALGFFLSPFRFGGFIVLGAAWIWYAYDLLDVEEVDVDEPPTVARR